jgi:tetratricopeptide (TPR) repeat protein
MLLQYGSLPPRPSDARAETAEEIRALNEQVAELYAQGKYKEATPIAEQALALAERTLDQGHSETINALDHLAALLRERGRYNEAEPLYERALAARERTLG